MIIKPFVKKFPDIQLKIKEATTDQLISDLECNEIDGAILATPVTDTDMFEYPLYKEALKVYGVTNKQKTTITLKEIKKNKIWLLQEGHCLSDQVVSICDLDEKSFNLEGLEMQCNSFATLIGLVDDFGGYTLLPEFYVNMMSKSRQNRTRSFKSPEPKRQISMMVYRPFAKKQLVDSLINFVKEKINQ